MPGPTQSQVNNACIDNHDEEWRDIPGYEGLYLVSSAGRVKRLRTTTVEFTADGDIVNTRNRKEYILKQSSNRQDYKVVGLTKLGNTSVTAVHRLIATAFVPRLPSQTEVHHIDKDRRNNDISNLEWLTPEQHAEKHTTKERWRP